MSAHQPQGRKEGALSPPHNTAACNQTGITDGGFSRQITHTAKMCMCIYTDATRPARESMCTLP